MRGLLIMLEQQDNEIEQGIPDLDNDVSNIDELFDKYFYCEKQMGEVSMEEFKEVYYAKEGLIQDIKRAMNVSFDKLSKVFSRLDNIYKLHIEHLIKKKSAVINNWDQRIQQKLHTVDATKLGNVEYSYMLDFNTVEKLMLVNENLNRIVANFEFLTNSEWREGKSIFPSEMLTGINLLKDIGMTIPVANALDRKEYKATFKKDSIKNLGYSLSTIEKLVSLVRNHTNKMNNLYKLHKQVIIWNNFIRSLSEDKVEVTSDKDKNSMEFKKVKLNRAYAFLKMIDCMFIIEKDIFNVVLKVFGAIDNVSNQIGEEALGTMFVINSKSKEYSDALSIEFNNSLLNINGWLKDYSDKSVNFIDRTKDIQMDSQNRFNLNESVLTNVIPFSEIENRDLVFVKIFDLLQDFKTSCQTNDTNEIINTPIKEINSLFNQLGLDISQTLRSLEEHRTGSILGDTALANIDGNDNREILFKIDIKDVDVKQTSTFRDTSYTIDNINRLVSKIQRINNRITPESWSKLSNDIHNYFNDVDTNLTSNNQSLTKIWFNAQRVQWFIYFMAALRVSMKKYYQNAFQVLSLYEDVNVLKSSVESYMDPYEDDKDIIGNEVLGTSILLGILMSIGIGLVIKDKMNEGKYKNLMIKLNSKLQQMENNLKKIYDEYVQMFKKLPEVEKGFNIISPNNIKFNLTNNKEVVLLTYEEFLNKIAVKLANHINKADVKYEDITIQQIFWTAGKMFTIKDDDKDIFDLLKLCENYAKKFKSQHTKLICESQNMYNKADKDKICNLRIYTDTGITKSDVSKLAEEIKSESKK